MKSFSPPSFTCRATRPECIVGDASALGSVFAQLFGKREAACPKEEARLKPGFLVAVTPTTRSWNQFSAFIAEWDELRGAA